MNKKYFLHSILIISLVTLFEVISWGFLNFTPIGRDYRNGVEALESSGNYRWYPSHRLFLPIPNSVITTPKEEYIDRFPTMPLPGLPGGFFDNGLINRPIRALALGDSFTRGVGSENQLKFGWVGLLENEVSWLDTVNLGNSGTGTLQQLNFYQRVAPYIRHELVLINFYTGNDFTENAEPFDWNIYLDTLNSENDATKTATGIQRALTKTNPRFAAADSCKFMSNTLKLYCYLYRIRVPVNDMEDSYYISLYENIVKDSESSLVPREITLLARENIKNARLLPDLLAGKRIFIRQYQKDTEQAEKLANHSAKLVRVLVNSIKSHGAIPVLVIHPSAVEVYDFKRSDLKDMGYATKILKKSIPDSLSVLDLTSILQNYASSDPSRIYYDIDDHYTPYGYSIVAKEIGKFIRSSGDVINLRQ